MNASQVDPLLLEIIADRKVSPSEKTKFIAWLTPYLDSPQDRLFIQSRVFEIARQQISDAPAKELITWLSDMVKLLNRSDAAPKAIDSSAFFSPGPDCLNQIIARINAAKKSCDICVFTITDDRIARPILASHHRGIKIRIITDDEKAEDIGSDIAEFRRAGISVVTDHSPHHMHHKFCILDSVTLITGSFNWTRSASEANQENIVVTNDGKLLLAFQKQFDFLWTQLEKS